MFDIEEELKKLPNKPGVYLMHDKDDNIIYVGKAVILKNRVRQYFRKNNKTTRIEKMVSLIDHFEYIVVESEDEALILECNLIKKYRPKFNVLLKDDKSYPYIKVDIKSDYPGVFMTRRILNDGAKYFGPYPSVSNAKEMVNFIKEKFQIRQCKNFKNRDRACLNYHIKKCLAPCMGYVSKEEYRKQIDGICLLLDGKIEEIIKNLQLEMKEASEKMEFEKAASIRDRIIAIERVSEKQKVSNISENNIDVIGLYKNEVTVCIEVFFIRNSKMIGREHYFFDELKDMTEDVIKSDSDNQRLSNVSFAVLGKGVAQTTKTDNNGVIDVYGLYVNEEYHIQERRADGYYLDGSERTFKVVRNSEGSFAIETEDEIISGFIKQYYLDKKEYPSKIMLRYELEEKDVLENWLSNKANRKVELKSPKKGEKLKFVEMAELNSKITLENKVKDNTDLLIELRDVLNLENVPVKIESFDISNISGNFLVARNVYCYKWYNKEKYGKKI